MKKRTPELALTIIVVTLIVAVAAMPDKARKVRVYDGSYSETTSWHEEEQQPLAILLGPLRAVLVAVVAVARETAGAGLAVVCLFLVFTFGYLNDRRRKAGLDPFLNVRRPARNFLMDIGSFALVTACGLIVSLTTWMVNYSFWPHVYSLMYVAIAVMTVLIPVRLLVPWLLGRVLSPDAMSRISRSRMLGLYERSRVFFAKNKFTRRFVMALGVTGIGMSLWYGAHYVPGAEHALVAGATGSGASYEVPKEGPYLIDFHAHTIFSDGFYSPTDLIQLMIENGFHGCVISDHDGIQGALEAERIAREKYPNFLVIPGLEFTTDRVHLVLMGIRENISPRQSGGVMSGRYEHVHDGAGNRMTGDGYSIPDAIERVHELGGLVIVAHWRAENLSKEKLLEWGVDGFEVANWWGGDGMMDDSVVEFCKSHRARYGDHHLIMVGSTDAHSDRVAKVANEIDSGDLTVEAVLDALRSDGKLNKVIIRTWDEGADIVPAWTPEALRRFIYAVTRLSPVETFIWAVYAALAIYVAGAVLRSRVLIPIA